jgi:TonB family protein
MEEPEEADEAHEDVEPQQAQTAQSPAELEQMARAQTPGSAAGQLPPSDPNYIPQEGEGDLDLGAFSPTLTAYQEHLGQQDRRERQRVERHMRYEGYLAGDDQAEWERTRAALENMIPEARFGTETELNARASQYAQYLTHIHRNIHAMWADGFLVSLDLDPLGPLNNPNLEAVVELVIGANGEVTRVNLVDASGETMFDSEAIAVAYNISPLEPPPSAIVSGNGNAYIHWTFWRDHRQCGTFGASVHRVE